MGVDPDGDVGDCELEMSPYAKASGPVAGQAPVVDSPYRDAEVLGQFVHADQGFEPLEGW